MNLSVFVRTTENWAPSYTLNEYNWGVAHQQLLEVLLGQTGPNPPINGEWRVGVWGGDDFGMIKDFKNIFEAHWGFAQVIALENVTRQALEELGFNTF